MSRVLLLHPEDDPYSGLHANCRWDRIVDLGFAGETAYQKWSQDFGCPVSPLPRPGPEEFWRLRQLVLFGAGSLRDDRGIDWWEALLLGFYENALKIYCLERSIAHCAKNDELFISRAGFHSQVLEHMRPGAVQILASRATLSERASRRIARVSRLRPQQIVEILCDKYDGDYRLRRLWASRQTRGGNPVVLLPTAYGNASNTALAYARTVSNLRFLLVATRKSGVVADPPSNVTVRQLASYAPQGDRRLELKQLEDSWRKLADRLCQFREFEILSCTGSLAFVHKLFADGLSVRDAWEQVLATEPVVSVLCADEKNPFGRVPILLARQRGLPTIACHHGALDGRYWFTDIRADKFLAKGQMEWDYLVRQCGVPQEKVAIGAPNRATRVYERGKKKTIVFFSEPYEGFEYRARQIYSDVIPALVRTAEANGCSLVIKLHPFESFRERSHLVNGVIPSELQPRVTVVAGALTETLLGETWFGVTVSSTTALDCAIRGVPAFICMWLDHHGFRYADHFVKFGVARALHRREEITEIPSILESICPASIRDLWKPLIPEHLTELLAAEEAARLV